MPKQTISRSVSFDKDVFAAMNERCDKLLMGRSEYIKRLIIRDMIGEKDMVVSEVPRNLVSKKSPRKSGR